MIVGFKSSFVRDIKKINDKQILSLIEKAISNVENATDLKKIDNIKKLTGYKSYYRIRIKDYRLGVCIENDTVYFVRFCHRKEIYKVFP